MCDSMAIVKDGAVLFAKNSDRDANEGQNIEWYERQRRAGGTVKCTHIEIPDIEETHAIMISRPFWIWGAEIGTNEHGVTIGNESVFTKTPYEKEPGLIGMDLLRLALERAASASEACAVIAELLEKHGQCGSCGLEDPKFTYFNSFIIADPGEAYVFETSGRLWITEKINGARSISNGLTIPGFAEEHSDFLYTKFSGSKERRARTQKLCNAGETVQDLMEVLRDHGGAVDPTYHFVNGGMTVPCVHGGGAIASSQSAASWVAELSSDSHRHWVTATAAPCTGIFKPVAVDTPVDYGAGAKDIAGDSLWWRHQRFQRQVMRNPGELSPIFTPERIDVETAWLTRPPSSREAFDTASKLLENWTKAVVSIDVPDTRPIWTRRYWDKRNKWSNLEL